MVMIVSAGRLPENSTYNATCMNCKTVFTFTRGEALLVDDQRDGDYLQISCPLEGCAKDVNVAVERHNYGR